MTRIGIYLNTTVTIVKIALASGDRTEVEVPNVPAARFRANSFVRTPTGDSYVSKTFIGFLSNVDIDGEDEIIVDGVKRPIANIEYVKESRFSTAVDHIEVELG